MTTVIAPTIRDLFPAADLAAALDGGYVRQQLHPSEPLAILNYTEKAAYENAWGSVTVTCRGLVHHVDTLELVARPFRKFFNYGQAGSAVIALDAAAVVTDKADGSLGILYPLPSGGWAVATRGSFSSDQALHATAVYHDRYANRFDPDPGVTYLFEIVYPANRIVLDYGDLDELILLGAVDIATGRDVAPSGWPGLVIDQFPYATLADALAAPPRRNAEGLVVHLIDTGDRVKIKQEDYVALHRIVTGLTARTVWEHMVAGKPLDELIAPLPDEFHPWVAEVAAGIGTAVAAEAERLTAAFLGIVASMPAGWQPTGRAGRKDFAAVAATHPDKWAMFLLLDGRDIHDELLKRAKPEPYITPSGRTYTEDTA